jgi:hypothetical protein
MRHLTSGHARAKNASIRQRRDCSALGRIGQQRGNRSVEGVLIVGLIVLQRAQPNEHIEYFGAILVPAAPLAVTPPLPVAPIASAASFAAMAGSIKHCILLCSDLIEHTLPTLRPKSDAGVNNAVSDVDIAQ